MTRKFDGYCSHCQRLITGSAIIGIGRCCLVKNYKDWGCPNHGKGELVIKKNWIGVRNCDWCAKEDCPPFTYGKEQNINQIVWEL